MNLKCKECGQEMKVWPCWLCGSKEHGAFDCPKAKFEPPPSCANEKEESKTVKTENTQETHCAACGSWKHNSGDCPEIKPSESLETFDWTVAAKLWTEGESIQVKGDIGSSPWFDLDDQEMVCFYRTTPYRRKPSSEKPKYDRETIVTELLPGRIVRLEERVLALEKALHANGIYE